MRTIPLFAVAAMTACGSDTPTIDPGSGLEAPVECRVTAAPADWSYPAGPYGGDVGNTFADFSLDDCDGNPVSFSNVLAGAELVLFNVGAGWCQPCIEESRVLDDEVFRPFCGRGLRVVQVLFQDEESGPATKLFCRQWRQEFGLSFPVLVDPLFVTESYFDAAQTPLNMLVDPSGVIRFRQTGTVPADLTERIDTLLP